MDIYFLGLTTLRIKGKKTTLVIDPFSKEKTEADGILITAKNATSLSLEQVSGYRVIIDGPGEYEVGGVAVVGYPMDAQTTYYIKMDGISLLDLGQPGKPPTDADLDKYPNIDVLFLASGIDAAAIIAKLEPKIVVPFYTEEAALGVFLKEIGKEGIKPQPKLSITREKLPAEMEVIMLE